MEEEDWGFTSGIQLILHLVYIVYEKSFQHLGLLEYIHTTAWWLENSKHGSLSPELSIE